MGLARHSTVQGVEGARQNNEHTTQRKEAIRNQDRSPQAQAQAQAGDGVGFYTRTRQGRSQSIHCGANQAGGKAVKHGCIVGGRRCRRCRG